MPQNVVVRGMPADRAEEFFDIFAQGFHLNKEGARPFFYQDPFFDPNLKRVCEVDGVCVSCLTVVPVQIRIGAAIVPMAGIAGVATLPAHQRQGYAGMLLADAVTTSAAVWDMPLAGLFPAVPAYYARFGWTWAMRAFHATVQLQGRPGRPAAGSGVRRYEHDRDYQAVARLHDSLTAARTGSCVRDHRRWTVIHKMLSQRVEVVCDGGYLHYELVPSTGKVVVYEIRVGAPAAASLLLAHLATLHCTHVDWLVDPLDFMALPLDSVGVDSRRAKEREPDAMLRITNLTRALELAHPGNFAPVLDDGEAVTVIARDAINPANELPIRIAQSGVQQVTSITTRDWISADISVLTQLYTGYTMPSEAYAVGNLRASGEHAVAGISDRLFPSRNPHIPILDHF